ncbi:MAG: RAMP superfamily protein [Halothece sp.]
MCNISQIPMMYRAQLPGRCQLQYIDPVKSKNQKEQDSERWTSEWLKTVSSQPPKFSEGIRVQSYDINWRFVTNGGQDDGIIRPVIGAKGYPYYPGSSMKGVFRRACTPQQAQRYCGGDSGQGDFTPGLLRFHGGYPVDNNWQNQNYLVDIIHGQQDWQVKSNEKKGALAQISLYQPTLKFGISSTVPLEESEWETIWKIWEKGLSTGIGCRVSAGYGQPKMKKANFFYKTGLQGQGMASKLVTGEAEFRPNMFKAALRGHALRLFGGLTTADNAEKLVQELFGGVKGETTVGLLGVSFQFSPDHLNFEDFGRQPYTVTAYNVKGQLCFSLNKQLPEDQKKVLMKVIKALTRFAMLFGGFGKSWRRADHQKFFPEYYEGGNAKPLIGCHWQWYGEASRFKHTRNGVRNLKQVPVFIDDRVRSHLQEWMALRGISPTPNNYAQNWREAWHPKKVQVWGRIATDNEDSRAIEWLHKPYRRAIREARIPEGTIYNSSVTGSMGNIGRIWHRMYPLVTLEPDPNNPEQYRTRPTDQYLELFTFFPSDYPDQQEREFLNFLENQQEMFQLLWGK